MKHRVLISAGGTGGHVFPAVALAQQITTGHKDVDILFAAGGLSANRFFPKEQFSFQSYPCATFSLRKPWTLPRSCWRIVQGLAASTQILNEYKPQVVVGFGSYYTFPMLLAASLKKIPIVLHEQNSLPGKVNKLMSKRAVATGVHFPCSIKELAGHVVEVGMPLRQGFARGSCAREKALEYFSLHPHLLTLLVFGGSQGAQRLNQVVFESLSLFPDAIRTNMQIIHVVGSPTEREKFASRYKELDLPVCLKEFEPRMDLAWQAADLVISRAGASSIAEQLEFEIPGILIPYPYATDRHQDRNAEFLAHEVGGACILQEQTVKAADLACEVEKLMASAETKRQAMRSYKSSHRQQNLCSLVLDVCQIS